MVLDLVLERKWKFEQCLVRNTEQTNLCVQKSFKNLEFRTSQCGVHIVNNLLCLANRSISCSESNWAAVDRTTNLLCDRSRASNSQLIANENRPFGPSSTLCDSETRCSAMVYRRMRSVKWERKKDEFFFVILKIGRLKSICDLCFISFFICLFRSNRKLISYRTPIV